LAFNASGTVCAVAGLMSDKRDPAEHVGRSHRRVRAGRDDGRSDDASPGADQR
jgi:hypothetical protein